MKKLVPLGEARSDPRKAFGVAWVAAFLGVVLTIALVYWAIFALGTVSTP